MEVDGVIFDIGNVLIQWNARNLYRKLIRDPQEMEQFIATALPMAWHETLDAGKSFAMGVAERAAQFPHYAHWIRAWDERWQETHGGVIEGSVAILSELKAAGIPVYAITNYNAEKFAEDSELYDFYGWFNDRIVSGEVGVIKPNPAIYHKLLDRNQLKPERQVFIDDRADNVKGAESVGLRGCLFTSAEQLRIDLKALGLPV